LNSIVRFDKVRKSFGSNEILKGVSFEVGSGQVVALIGRSGSGKSTALRCINGLETINGGELHVCGRPMHQPGLDLQSLRKDVGIVFQSYNLFPHLTVEQNVTLAPRKVNGIGASEAQSIAAYPDQLSGGQQQRVAIARSLAMKPKLMLFDEVTSALDPELTGEVLKVIENLAADGMTMVLVTHEMAFARNVADQILFMHHGIVWESGNGEMLKQPATAELNQFVCSGL